MTFTKCLLLMAVAVVVCSVVRAYPVQPEETDFDAVARKFEEDAQRQFEEFKKQAEAGFPQLPPLDVKNLPKDDNAHVYGQSQSSYHVESNINGKKQEENGGHTVINDDGKITEYDSA